MANRRLVTLSVPPEVVQKFDEVTPEDESRSSWITKLMIMEIQKYEK